MTDLEAAAGVRAGDVLAGKYRIDRVLGVGGMGVVVAAHHIQLDERVALKFLRTEALFDNQAVERFAREARAAVKIKSEHVARVSDVGVLEDGAPYMVIEYLEGEDLADWLMRRGPLPLEQAAEFVLQACEAIAEAHVLGIVHRDLKPANLYVIRRADGVLSVKVLDFGISKMTGLSGSGTDRSMTKTSALMGSPLYMSPEQMQSPKDVDSRCDLWALGIILYELLAGTTPFSAETMPELVLKIVTSPPPALRDRRPDAPSGIEAVILKCLEKDRGLRYSSVGELAVALAEFAPRRARGSVERIAGVMRSAGMSASSLALPPSVRVPEVHESQTIAPLGRTVPGTFRRGKTIGVAAGVIAVAALSVVLLSRHAPSSPPPPVAQPEASAQAAAPAAEPIAAPPSSLPVVTPEALATESAHVAERPAVVRTPKHAAPNGHTTPQSSPQPAAPAVSAAVPRPTAKKTNCDPNFYLDAQGEKHFKPECF